MGLSNFFPLSLRAASGQLAAAQLFTTAIGMDMPGKIGLGTGFAAKLTGREREPCVIRPIQPVNCYYSAPVAALYECWRGLAADCLTIPPGIHKSFALVPLLSSSVFQVDRSLGTPLLESSGTWQPWPAEPAFADEVTRWWPSDEKPPTSIEPARVYSAGPCSPSDFVYFPLPVRGSLLNMTV